MKYKHEEFLPLWCSCPRRNHRDILLFNMMLWVDSMDFFLSRQIKAQNIKRCQLRFFKYECDMTQKCKIGFIVCLPILVKQTNKNHIYLRHTTWRFYIRIHSEMITIVGLLNIHSHIVTFSVWWTPKINSLSKFPF